MSKCTTYYIVKLQSFEATDFHVWKIHVQLGMKEREIFYTVLSTFATTKEDVDEYQWTKDEDFCKDYLLNSLNPRLAMTYRTYKTAKEIWDHLNAQFQNEEGLSKTLLGEKFFNFKFNLNSTVTSQLPDLENLRLKLADDESDMSDNLFVSMILSKLPPEWIVFKTEMHRLKERIALDELKRIKDMKGYEAIYKNKGYEAPFLSYIILYKRGYERIIASLPVGPPEWSC